MGEKAFLRFIELVEFDKIGAQIAHQKKQLQDTLTTLRTEHGSLIERLEKAREHYIQARKDVDAQELELKSMDEQERKKKEQLATLTNPKQHQSLRRELETLVQERQEKEEVLLSAWRQVETAQRHFEQEQTEVAQQIAQIAGQMNEMQKELEELGRSDQGRNADRLLLINDIPSPWMEKYEAMQGQLPNPAVPVQDTFCSACFSTITPAELQRLRRNAILNCKGCFRFLYYPIDR